MYSSQYYIDRINMIQSEIEDINMYRRGLLNEALECRDLSVVADLHHRMQDCDAQVRDLMSQMDRVLQECNDDLRNELNRVSMEIASF